MSGIRTQSFFNPLITTNKAAWISIALKKIKSQCDKYLTSNEAGI